jgi:hypothetical protein
VRGPSPAVHSRPNTHRSSGLRQPWFARGATSRKDTSMTGRRLRGASHEYGATGQRIGSTSFSMLFASSPRQRRRPARTRWSTPPLPSRRDRRARQRARAVSVAGRVPSRRRGARSEGRCDRVLRAALAIAADQKALPFEPAPRPACVGSEVGSASPDSSIASTADDCATRRAAQALLGFEIRRRLGAPARRRALSVAL